MTVRQQYWKSYYNKNRLKIREKQSKDYYSDKKRFRRYCHSAQDKKREFVNRIKMSPCMDCKKQYNPWVMDFDHVKGRKVNDIAKIKLQCGWKKLKKEIAKCEVVCANCHRDRTHKRAL